MNTRCAILVMRVNKQHILVKGLVLREVDFGDNDRYITVLTEEGALIEVFCRGVRAKNARYNGAVRLFCYSEFTLYASREKYKLHEAAEISSFWGLTQDIEGYALGCYFAELILLFCTEPCPPITTLALYAFHALCRQKQPFPLIKAAFELRLLCECGFMPQLQECGVCGRELPGAALFSVTQGGICCPDCAKKSGGNWLVLPAGTLAAMRHMLDCTPAKLFSFTLGKESAQALARAAEQNMLYYTQKEPDSLKLYQSLQITQNTGAKT